MWSHDPQSPLGSYCLQGLAWSWNRSPWAAADGMGRLSRALPAVALFLLPAQHPLPFVLGVNLLWVVLSLSMWFSQLTLPQHTAPPPRPSDWEKVAPLTQVRPETLEIWLLRKGFLPGHRAKQMQVLLTIWKETVDQVQSGAFSYHTIWVPDPALPGAKIRLYFTSTNSLRPIFA